jgi:hypothetical protein
VNVTARKTHWGEQDKPGVPRGPDSGKRPMCNFRRFKNTLGIPEPLSSAQETGTRETSRMCVSPLEKCIGDPRAAQECPRDWIRGNVPDVHFATRKTHWGAQSSPGVPRRLDPGKLPRCNFRRLKSTLGIPEPFRSNQETESGETSPMCISPPEKRIPGMPRK